MISHASYCISLMSYFTPKLVLKVRHSQSVFWEGKLKLSFLILPPMLPHPYLPGSLEEWTRTQNPALWAWSLRAVKSRVFCWRRQEGIRCLNYLLTAFRPVSLTSLPKWEWKRDTLGWADEERQGDICPSGSCEAIKQSNIQPAWLWLPVYTTLHFFHDVSGTVGEILSFHT